MEKIKTEFFALILIVFGIASIQGPTQVVDAEGLANGTPLYAQDFEAFAQGSDPADWLDTAANNSMAEDNSLFAVATLNGNQVLSTSSNASNIHSHYVGSSSASFSQISFSGRMMMTASNSGIGVTFLSDYNQSDSYYRLRRYGNGGSFHISPHGASIGGDVNSDVVPAANVWYRFRIEVEDVGTQTEIRANVWEEGTTEPAEWQIDAYDNSAGRRTAGTIGVWSYLDGSKYWDDLVVEALSPPGPHTLTVSTSGGGAVVADPNLVEYPDGTGVQLTATADSGWVFVEWSGDLSGSDNPATVVMDGDRSITATFVEDVPLTMSTNTIGSGVVTVTPDQSDYNAGEVVTLTATPNNGWQFGGWSGDLSGSTNPATIVMDGDKSITATFSEQPPGLVNEDFSGNNAGDNPAGWQDTAANNSMAEDDALFTVVDVGGSLALGTSSTQGNIHSHFQGTGSTTAGNYVYSGRMMVTSGNGGIGVTFLSDYNQSDSYYRLRRYGNGGSFHISPHGTTMTGGVADSGVVPAPDTWYEFKIEVEDTGSQTNIRARVWEAGTAEPTSWQIEAYDDSSSRRTRGTVGVWSYANGSKYWDDLSVTYLTAGPYTLTLTSAGNGTVSVEPDQVEYNQGEAVTLTAVADAGWQFDSWSGDLSGSNNPATMVMDSNKEVTATFIVMTPPPSAVDDNYSTDEDTMLVVPTTTGLLANDQDNNLPEDLTTVLVSDVSYGVLNLNADSSFDYMPALNFNGVDSFTYDAVDGASGARATAAVTLTVNAVNDAPVSVDDNYQVAPGTTLVVGAANGVLVNDSDPDLDPLQAVLVSDVVNGVLNLNDDGSFDYTPSAGSSGQDSFTYRANDAVLESGQATVTLTVDDDNSAPQIVSGEIAFARQIIGTGMDETHAVVAADLNGDGFIDAAATDYVNGHVFWYENDGNGAFVARLLDANLEGAYPAHVGDVDLDGDLDLLAAGYLADAFVWYENDGSGGFTRHDIDTATDGPHSIVTGDMDLDGDVDLLTTSQDAGNVAWYENDGGNNFTRHIIDTSAAAAKRAEFADVDGDGDVDVVSASYDVDEVAWLENDGNQSFTKHVITAGANGAYFVSPADVDGDGDVDVLSASRLDNTIAWYENLGGGNFDGHLIDTDALGARTVIVADVDGDGAPDAISTSVDDDTIAWYNNDGSGNFTGRGIDLAADGAYGVFATDMDGDDDLDVLSASRDANAVALHTQIRTHQASVAVGGALVIDDSVLLTVDVDDPPVGLTYTLTDPPIFGGLELNGIPLPAGGTFTQDDVNNGRLAYVHNGVDASPDGFSFTVQDGGENGIRPAGGSFAIIVTGAGDTIVHFPLDEGQGTVAGDAGGFGNDGTLVNGATFEADSGDDSSFSVRFDGLNDRIDLASLDVNGSGLTLATWFKADSFPGSSNDPRLISKASSTAANDHVFMLSTIESGSAVRLRARVRIGGTTTTLIALSGDLQTGVWYHAAMTYDGVALRLYLDGTEVGSTLLSGAVDVDPSLPVAVGSQPAGAGSNHFDGLIDDVRILQRALSVSEIEAITAGSTVSHTLSVNVVGNGTVATVPDQPTYTTGETVQLTATADPGWIFVGWSGDLSGSDNPATVVMDGDKSITATFVEDVSLTLTTSTSGNGVVAVTPDQPDYNAGDTVTLTATADNGWQFDGWSGDLSGSDNPATIVMDGDKGIMATFSEQPPGLVNEDFSGYSAGDDPAGWQDTAANNSMAEDDTLFAVVDVGGNLAFGTSSTQSNIHSHYQGTGSATAGNYVYSGRMMVTSGNGGIGVTFLSDYSQSDSYYRLRRYGNGGSFHVSPHGTGISGDVDSGVVPATDTWYEFKIEVEDTGSQTNIRARVWEVGAAEPTSWQIEAYDDSSSRRTMGTVGVWSYANGSKYWDDLSVTYLTSGPYTLALASEGNGTVTAEPDQVEYTQGEMVTLTAVADAGWQFDGWSGDLTGANNPITITMSGDRNVTGLFTQIPTYTLSTGVVGNGAIILDPDQSNYLENSSVTFTATPAAGWRFTGWSGDLAGTVNPVMVTMDTNKVISATFVEDVPLSLVVNTVGNGTTVKSPDQSSYAFGDTVTITATANAGWQFAGWTSNPPIDGSWWDTQWDYRLPVTVNGAGYARTNAPAEVVVDFTAAWSTLGASGELDLNSLRVVEVDGEGNLLDAAVPFQFDPALTFDAATNATGTLIVLLTGSTGSATDRNYHVYFDETGKGFVPAPVAPLVTLTDNVEDEGLTTFRIENDAATYFYDKQGGGFSSIVDAEGNDWINYNSTPGSAGTYRGVPNLVYPEGYMHPGANGVISTIVNQGPLKATIHSETTDGSWKTMLEVYPHFARLTVLQSDHSYWFLFEGTPGGVLDLSSDIVVRADGTQTLANEAWTGDLAGEEWVYFGDPNVARSLYIVNHQRDSAVDSYYAMEGNMTVFGFGRSGINSYLNTVPATFTLGLVNDTGYGNVSGAIAAAYQPLSTSIGATETQGSNGSIEGKVFTFEIKNNYVVTATFVELISPTLSVATSGNGNVAVEPELPQYAFGQTITVTATPDAGWHFSSWSGDLSGTINPTVLTMDGNKDITATFVAQKTSTPVIDVWYGNSLRYGHLGLPQPWFNILGNVIDPDGVSSLVYSLNDGASVNLSIGSDDRRLANPGDFNVDLNYQDLIEGNNQVVITATDELGNEASETVTVVYDGGNIWPATYSVDWSTTTAIEDVAQIVDGKWALTSNGIRILEPEYDRLVAIGDLTWVDYEVVVPITIHEVDHAGAGGGSGDPGLGLLIRWGGHTDTPISGWQPKTGWVPYGAIGWWRWSSPTNAELGIYGTSVKQSFSPQLETVYLFKMRVESTAGQGGLYSVKVWESGQPEPGTWNLSYQEGSSDVSNGSLLLLAHHVDATFGDVTVTSLGSSTPITLDVAVDGNGSVTVDPERAEYAYGESVTLTAVADADWVFAGWQGDLLDSGNPTTVAMTESKQITATFVAESSPPTVSDVVVSMYSDWAMITWSTDKPASSAVSYGETSNYELGSISDNILKTNHSITLTGLISNATYHYQVTSVDGNGNTSSTADATFTTTDGNNPSGIVSDDFNACTIDNGLWTFVNPVGDGTVEINGTQVALSVPAGTSHDVWSGGNMAPRLMQAANDTDFELDVKYETIVSEQYEMQGVIVEQDANNYLRFDFYGSNGQVRTFAARIVNGTASSLANVVITVPDQPLYMRITRVGDNWTQSYSTDGTTWTTSASFTHSLAVSQVGVFAGNAGSNPPAHTAVVDYFFNTDLPVVPEDGSGSMLTVNTVGSGSVSRDPDQALYVCGESVTATAAADEGWVFDGWSGALSGTENPATLQMDSSKVLTATFIAANTDTTPPVISNVQVVVEAETATITWQTDEPASSEVEYGETSSYELGNVNDSTLHTSHAITLTGLISNTTYHYQIVSVDGSGNVASSADATFTTIDGSNLGSIVSDDFNACTIDNGLWTFVNPVGDGTVAINGTQLELSVPDGTGHDVWSGGNMAPRLMQAAADVDFEVEVKYESAVSEKYEMQGLIVEQDAGNFLRFDFYGNGGQTYVFAARFVNGSPSAIANVSIGNVDQPLYMRITRSGDTWTQSYSTDGTTWTTSASFTHSLAVSQVGVFAGNAGSSPPAHTAMVDYFFNTATPIVPEDANNIASCD